MRTANDITRLCNKLITQSVKDRTMWPLFSANIQKAIDKGLFFTKWDGDTLIAFMLCRLLKRTGKLSLDKITVHKDYRNRGFGTEMINELKKYNLPIKLDVANCNHAAIRFYERYGFNKTGEKILGKTHISIYEYKN